MERGVTYYDTPGDRKTISGTISCDVSRYFIQIRLIGQFKRLTRSDVVGQLCKLYKLAGHPRSGCPARLRGHKGSGLWKVWTVPSPPLPCPALPSLPPSRVPNLIKLGPAVWPKLQPAEARECSAALAISEWTRRLSAMLIIARRKMLF